MSTADLQRNDAMRVYVCVFSLLYLCATHCSGVPHPHEVSAMEGMTLQRVMWQHGEDTATVQAAQPTRKAQTQLVEKASFVKRFADLVAVDVDDRSNWTGFTLLC